jgi:hypothetical protein
VNTPEILMVSYRLGNGQPIQRREAKKEMAIPRRKCFGTDNGLVFQPRLVRYRRNDMFGSGITATSGQGVQMAIGATKQLPLIADNITPDGAESRRLIRTSSYSTTVYRLYPGQILSAFRNRTLEEF